MTLTTNRPGANPVGELLTVGGSLESDPSRPDRDLTRLFYELCDRYSLPVSRNWRLISDPDTVSAVSNADPDRYLVPANRRFDANGIIPLLSWRNERRFVELRDLVTTRTIDDVQMCRFSYTGSRTGESLSQILFHEYDLLEWITGSQLEEIYATVYDGVFANVVATLANGAVCSIEAGRTLPRSGENVGLDRHELIARRGVASDRVVDSQMPQESVYLLKEDTQTVWTDTDAELFGLPLREISFVRAALAFARAVAGDSKREQELAELSRSRTVYLDRLVSETFSTAKSGMPVRTGKTRP